MLTTFGLKDTRFARTGKMSDLHKKILEIIPLEGEGVTHEHIASLLPEYAYKTIKSALSMMRQCEEIEKVGGTLKTPLLRRTY